MKPQELRIGNWYAADDPNRGKYFQITAKDIVCLEEDPQDDFYQPIPLTEEWLVKFGFVKKVDYEQDEDEWGRLSESNPRRGVGLYNPWEDKPNYWFVTFREDVGCGWSDLNEIEYVHQLQNIYFALTGEELTIE